MCVATAIIVGAAVAAGGTVASAAIQSHAAGKAGKTQSDAADKALAFQKEQYAQQRKDFDPYQQAGAAAAGRLGAQATAPVQGFRQPAGPPPQLGMPQGAPTSQPGQGGMPSPMPQQAGPGGTAGPLWTIQSPDGETKQLPPQVAQQFISRGAKRVA